MQCKKKSIWLLLDSSHFGGIESHVLQLAKGLKEYDENVMVVFMKNYGSHPMRDTLDSYQIPQLTLDGTLFSLYKAIRKFKPTIVHTHGYKAGIFGRFTALMCQKPSISTYHAGEISKGKVAIYDFIDRYTAFIADKVLTVSPLISNRLPVASHVVKNFVNTNGLHLSKGNEIAFVGRLSKEKGPDYFLELAKEFPGKQFHFYGDGPLNSSLKEIAPKNLIFHGQQVSMNAVWDRIGLLVMPSRYEGLPMAALEAMSRGIPVLASNVGALNVLIKTNTSGWLVEKGNIPAFSGYLTKWFSSSQQQRERYRQEASKVVVQHFSTQKVIPEIISNYKKLIV